jgi:hypothetical protein
MQEDPTFSELLEHGEDHVSPPAPAKAQPKKARKSSEKTKEDLVEDGKQQKPLTGCVVF